MHNTRSGLPIAKESFWYPIQGRDNVDGRSGSDTVDRRPVTQ